VLFAREGAKVLAVDRDLAAAQETQTVIAGEGGERIADVSIASEVDAMVPAASACSSIMSACRSSAVHWR
jgi:hypothetical protein